MEATVTNIEEAKVGKAVKREVLLINQVDWMHKFLWPLVVEFTDAAKNPGISAQSFFAYLIQGVVSRSVEVWGGFKDGECIAVLAFQSMGFPYYSCGLCSMAYAKETDGPLRKMVMQKFPEYLKRNNFKYFLFQAQTERHGKYFMKRCKEMGMKVMKDTFIFSGKRS